jgi:hypothetical protein
MKPLSILLLTATTIILTLIQSLKKRKVNPLWSLNTEKLKQKKVKRCEDSACDEGFYCIDVKETDKIIVDRIQLAKGKWCVPENIPPCSFHGGKLVWTLEKGWECVCLYPDILNGPSCSTMIACDGKGELNWDGLENPYTSKAKCSCSSGIFLEDDPLRCHDNPCLIDVPFENGKCLCDRAFFVESNVDGKCREPPKTCNWDFGEKTCHCPEGLQAVHCQSNFYSRPSEITKQCPLNSAGCECKVACPPCKNNGIVKMTESFPGKFDCACECVNKGNVHFYGPHCENACFAKGTEVPDGQIHTCCSGRASHWCENPPFCSSYTNVCL